jgi:predicted transcriptional regulator
MPRTPVDVTDTELAILEVLWEEKKATIRQIVDELYRDGTTGEYGAVQSLLERLEAKGYVRRDRSSFAHVFSAAIDRGDLIDQRLQAVAERLCGGSWTPLLMHLAEGTRLSAEDRKMLRKLLAEADKKMS